ncbi:MAG: hypothetical protein Barrevirus16_9 [Barrevirus sp.]|uniref:Uncharacterized protein n=1 Tax=Barrevirus sp. TaxID=2487763 RepID=A0A3G4ZT37_9VIRU|nr:MAG: hypothetical protein Barrevirus16_9 [Barrevirus sp.]
MQEVLSRIYCGYNPKSFDDVQSSLGNNEEYFRNSLSDHLLFGNHEGSENSLVFDSSDDRSAHDTLIRCLHGYSTDTDSNEESRALVSQYRASLVKTLEKS